MLRCASRNGAFTLPHRQKGPRLLQLPAHILEAQRPTALVDDENGRQPPLEALQQQVA